VQLSAVPTVIEGAHLGMTENRVLVRPAPEETVSLGGIVLPSSQRGRPTKGTIVNVGPGRRSNEGALISMDERFVPGAEIVFGVYSGTEIEVNGEVLLVLKEPDIYSVVVPFTKEEAEQAAAERVERDAAKKAAAKPAERPSGLLIPNPRTPQIVLP